MRPAPTVDLQPTPLRKSLPRLAIRFGVIAAFTYFALHGFEWLTTEIMKLDESTQSGAMIGAIALVLIGYALLLAIPFMPGVEVGIALLLMEGADIAPFVYAATLLGVFIAFAIGQNVPLKWLQSFFQDLRMMRVCRWLDRMQNSAREDRLERLTERLPSWLSRIAVDYRYVSIGILINLPGSFAIGGGGGIMMAAGLTRLFQTRWVILTLMIAVLPVPLAVWITGVEFLK